MNLEEKIIGDISGTFKIEGYQRGYRWSKEEIFHLLDDIDEIPVGQKYCLQPIVVKKINGYYELIDGQQRLTTLFLIMKYLSNLMNLIKYDIEYTTRKSHNGHMGSKELLQNINTIDLDSPSSNIDELFIKNAYKLITEWFTLHQGKQLAILGKIQSYLSVIWYEVDENENSTNIFTRLNIGKISLTNAELVKALFLSHETRDQLATTVDNRPHEGDEIQHEIALKWDQMEKGLHDEKFWAFITNADSINYPIRMELLFDIIERKEPDENNFYTFNKFYNQFKNSNSKYSTWQEIEKNYQQLKEWFSDLDLYHQIGFLVASGEDIKDLLEIAMDEKKQLTKSQFRQTIIDKIREKMIFKIAAGTPQEEEIEYAELNYEKHPQFIHTLLLLFNVETMRQKNDENSRFPFDRYKQQGNWSLEHIHAQNSESLKTNKEWQDWLLSHKKSLKQLAQEPNIRPEMALKISSAINKMGIIVSHIQDTNYKGSIRDEFHSVSSLVIELLSDSTDTSQMHTLSNMALLTVGENAALNNSTFDVKRNKIIEMDKRGEYIPICTRNVFLKYYSNSDTKLQFWSEEDRKCYIQEINNVLYNHKEKDDSEIRLLKSIIHYGK